MGDDIGGGAFHQNMTVVQDIGAVHDLEGFAHIVVRDQHADPALRQVAHRYGLLCSAPELAAHLAGILGDDPDRWMSEDAGYQSSVPLGSVMRGGGIARVLESRADGFRVGELVQARLGWQTHPTLPAKFSRAPVLL